MAGHLADDVWEALRNLCIHARLDNALTDAGQPSGHEKSREQWRAMHETHHWRQCEAHQRRGRQCQTRGQQSALAETTPEAWHKRLHRHHCQWLGREEHARLRKSKALCQHPRSEVGVRCGDTQPACGNATHQDYIVGEPACPQQETETHDIALRKAPGCGHHIRCVTLLLVCVDRHHLFLAACAGKVSEHADDGDGGQREESSLMSLVQRCNQAEQLGAKLRRLQAFRRQGGHASGDRAVDGARAVVGARYRSALCDDGRRRCRINFRRNLAGYLSRTYCPPNDDRCSQ
mmetsp:Transcript_10470/g.27734  ORF Transcript_10470/g.27734 Transcript_10470/m.27734 type:complete len:290 (+) Transcript_10470:839-1708(+)